MKNVPRFLTLLVFLLALGTGCSASPTPKSATKAKPKPAPTAKVEPVGSMYDELVANSALAKHMRGEPLEQTVFSCQATGDFNLAPIPNFIFMETWCINELALQEDEVESFQVEDQLAMRLDEDGYHFYVTPFVETVVEVKSDGSVFLLYKDEEEYRRLLLPKRSEEAYAYSFAKFVPNQVVPETQERYLQ